MSYCDRINCGYYYKGEDDDYEDEMETETPKFMSLETGECFTQTEMIADCKANHPNIDPYDGRSIWNYYKELED